MHFAKHLITEAIKLKQKLKSLTFHISCFDLADRIKLIELGGQHIVNELEMVDSKLLKNVSVNLTSDKLLSSDEMISRFEIFASSKKAEVKLMDEASFSFTKQSKKTSNQVNRIFVNLIRIIKSNLSKIYDSFFKQICV
jgi:hypothetical protein